MVSLFKKICKNKATLLTLSGGNLLIVRILIRLDFYLWWLPMWQLNLQSTRLWRKFIVKQPQRKRQQIWSRFIYQVSCNLSQVWQKGPFKKELQIQWKWFWWEFVKNMNKKASKIGHQEACDFRCRKYHNIHYEPKQKSVQMVYFLQWRQLCMVTTGSGNKIESRTG